MGKECEEIRSNWGRFVRGTAGRGQEWEGQEELRQE